MPSRARVGRTHLVDHRLARWRGYRSGSGSASSTSSPRRGCQQQRSSSGIGRRTAYDWRDRDPGFAQAWDDALDQAVDALARRLQIRGGGDLDMDRDQLLEQLRHLQRQRADLTWGRAVHVRYWAAWPAVSPRV